jgi:non-specific serine/threonine protein kinase
LHKLGQVSRCRHDNGLARARFAESLALQQELGNNQGIGECLAGLAATSAESGLPARAAQLFAASSTLLASIGVPLAPVDQLTLERDIEANRRQLGGAAWEQAWSAGSAFSTGQAIRLALVDDSDPRAAVPRTDREPEAGISYGRLSLRERQVTQLLARGLTYREISRALSISERTVGSHVEHIMTKLGIRSRTRVAVWAIEHGLGGSPSD